MKEKECTHFSFILVEKRVRPSGTPFAPQCSSCLYMVCSGYTSDFETICNEKQKLILNDVIYEPGVTDTFNAEVIVVWHHQQRLRDVTSNVRFMYTTIPAINRGLHAPVRFQGRFLVIEICVDIWRAEFLWAFTTSNRNKNANYAGKSGVTAYRR